MYKTFLSRALLGLIVMALLWLVLAFYWHGQWIFALLFLVLATALAVVFTKRSLSRHRYIFPALAGMGLFILFPLAYTVGIGFTNYSGSNLLSEERVREILLSRTYQEADVEYALRLYPADGVYRLYLEGGLDDAVRFVSPPLDLSDAEPRRIGVSETAAPPIGEAAGLREIIAAKQALAALTLITPQGIELSLASLRSFAPILPRYVANADGTLTDRQSGALLTPNHDTGFFVTAEGERVFPGWTVAIGFDNYQRVLGDPSIRGPFLQIFVWTLAFSLLTVAFTLAVGLVLATLLQWDQLRGKAIYRTLLILPYAVPAFISILVFKGLFNQNFGEINLILESLFGIKPAWFSDPWLARTMLLIVNTWLGYPYMLLLCMGLIQSIPRDLYEASAMDGGGAITNLLRITLPLIIKPLAPLLIAAFAFNFNNFVLIILLTGGGPDIIGASTPAGTTDLLVSYTYRIAFQSTGQNFGLAAAIATLIFLIVGGLSLLNLRLSKIKV